MWNSKAHIFFGHFLTTLDMANITFLCDLAWAKFEYKTEQLHLVSRVSLFCIKLVEFNKNHSSMTKGYWELF